MVSLLVFGCLEKERPSINRGNRRVCVENPGIFAGVNGLIACGTKGKRFLVVAGAWNRRGRFCAHSGRAKRIVLQVLAVKTGEKLRKDVENRRKVTKKVKKGLFNRRLR